MQIHGAVSEDSSPIHSKVTPKKIVSVLVANTLIALFIVVIYPDGKFIISFIYSQCIGISIATCSIAATDFIKTPKPALQVAFITASVVAGASIPSGKKFDTYRSNLAPALLFGAIMSYAFYSLQKLSDEKIKRLEVEKNAAITEIKLLQSHGPRKETSIKL